MWSIFTTFITNNWGMNNTLNVTNVLHFLNRVETVTDSLNCLFFAVYVRTLGGAVQKNPPKYFSAFSGSSGTRSAPSPCRQRAATCRDKMALYNFKKIMVVPTAKVSFVSTCVVFKLVSFCPPCMSAVRDRRRSKNMVELCWKGKHVLSWCKESAAGLQYVRVLYVVFGL